MKKYSYSSLQSHIFWGGVLTIGLILALVLALAWGVNFWRSQSHEEREMAMFSLCFHLAQLQERLCQPSFSAESAESLVRQSQLDLEKARFRSSTLKGFLRKLEEQILVWKKADASEGEKIRNRMCVLMRREVPQIMREILGTLHEEHEVLKSRTIWYALFVTCLSVVLSLTSFWALGKWASRSIREFQESLPASPQEALAGWEPPQEGPREVVQLGKTFSNLLQGLLAQQNTIDEGIRILSEIIRQIAESVSAITDSSFQIAQAAQSTQITSGDLRKRIQDFLSQSRITEELAEKADSIAQEGDNASKEVQQGMDLIEQQMREISQTVSRLSEFGQNIKEIVDTVRDIADQVQLLAVNASIEAAKAGEAGRGFGVVAREMKQLSEQSKEATEHIQTILKEIQRITYSAVLTTERGVKTVQDGQDRVRKMGKTIRELTDLLGESCQVAIKMFSSAQEYLQGTDNISLAVKLVCAAVDKNMESLSQLQEVIDNLQKMAQQLQEGVSQWTGKS